MVVVLERPFPRSVRGGTETLKSLGRYDILLEIGRGAMGIVYLGHDTKIDRPVALKCLRPEILDQSEDAQRRFRQEVLALGRLTHPNIVTIFDVGEEPDTGSAYIVMEYVDGTSLAQMIKKGEPLSTDQIIRIGIQICRALDFAHVKGVVHRDIKPGNILLTSNRQTVKVTDFGIARLDGGGQTQTERLLGTPQYMSPEQCRGERIDGRSDLFSVGALLYELLTRQKPFSGENIPAIIHQVLTQTPVPPSDLVPEIPHPLSNLVMKALSKEPDRRFSSGTEMAEALAAISNGCPDRPKRATEEPPTRILTQILRETEQTASSPTAVPRPVRWPIAIGVAAAVIAGGWMARDFFAEKQGGGQIAEVIRDGKHGPASNEEAPGLLSEKPGDVSAIPGSVDLGSTPAGADIILDGESKGVTPVTLDLPAGAHELLLKKKGYHPLEATITIAAGEKTPVHLKLTEEK